MIKLRVKKIFFMFAVVLLAFVAVCGNTASASYQVKKVTLKVSANNGNIYNRDVCWYGEKTSRVNQGTAFSLTAVGKDGSEFIYWLNANNRVVSTSAAYSFKVGSDTELKAVFAGSYDDRRFFAFKSVNGAVLKSGYVDFGSTVIPPDEKNIYWGSGYVFSGWDGSFSNIQKNTVLTAMSTKSSKKYNVSVTGGTLTSGTTGGSYEYETYLTVLADEKAIPKGSFFSGWSLDGGKSIVSYSRKYSFFVGADCNIMAVYSEFSAKALPAISVTDIAKNKSGGMVSFLSERYLPDGYELIESGILITQKSAYASIEKLNLENVDMSSVKKGVTTSVCRNGQYRASALVPLGGTAYARAYLIYYDENSKEVQTLYSPIYSEAI